MQNRILENKTLKSLDLSYTNLRTIIKLKSLKVLDISWNHKVHSFDFLPTNIKINSAWNR